VDNVTGNRLKVDEREDIYEVDDKSGAPILTGELENGAQDFVITEN
jgi:hypothetical protein